MNIYLGKHTEETSFLFFILREWKIKVTKNIFDKNIEKRYENINLIYKLKLFKNSNSYEIQIQYKRSNCGVNLFVLNNNSVTVEVSIKARTGNSGNVAFFSF